MKEHSAGLIKVIKPRNISKAYFIQKVQRHIGVNVGRHNCDAHDNFDDILRTGYAYCH